MATTVLPPQVNLPPTGIPLVDTGFTIIAQGFARAQSDISNALDTAAGAGGVGTVPTNQPVPSGITVRAGTDGSMDVSITWNYTNGTIPADYMIVFWKQGPATLAAPTANDKAVLLAATSTTFTWLGLDPASNYRFGVGAARKDSAGTAVAVGIIMSPDGTAGTPDWADINTTGNYTGPINLIPASTVTANAANGQTSYTQTANYRTTGAPSNLPVPNSLSAGVDTDGSARYTLGWTYAQGAQRADGFIVLIQEADTTTFHTTDPHFELALQNPPPTATYITLKGYPSDRILSFAVAAFRRTENSLEVTAPVTSTSGPDWTGISSGSPSYAGTIYGVDQHNFTLMANGRNASDTTNGLTRDGNPVTWANRDQEFQGGPHTIYGLSYNLTLFNLTNKTVDYQHCYDLFDYGGVAAAQDILSPLGTGGGAINSGVAGKFGLGLQVVCASGQRAYLQTQAAHADFTSLHWVECWFKSNGNPPSNAAIISVSQNADGSGYSLPLLYINPGGQVIAQMFDGSTTHLVAFPTPVCDNVWHHLAGAVTTTGLYVWADGFINGTPSTTWTSFTMGAPATLWLTFMGATAATQFFGTAVIDELIVSNHPAFRANAVAFPAPTTEVSDYISGVTTMYVWHLQEYLTSAANYPCNSRHAARSLAAVINSTCDFSAASGNKYAIIIGSGHEPQAFRTNDGLPDAITRIGGTKSLFTANSFQQYSAYGLVGTPNAGEGNGFEAYNGTIADDPKAHIVINFQSQNDKVFGTGGVGWKPVTTPGPPTNAPAYSAVAQVNRNTGDDLIVLTWTYTQPSLTGSNLLADGFVVYKNGGNLPSPWTGTPTLNYLGADSRKFFDDVPPNQPWSYAVAAYRHSSNGIEIGTPVTNTPWQGLNGNLVVTPGIADQNVTTPKVADNNVTTTKRQLVNTQSSTTGSLSANTGSNPVNFFAGSANVSFTHGLGRTATSTSSSSNSSAVGCWPANGTTTIVVTGQNFSTAAQTTTLTADYW